MMEDADTEEVPIWRMLESLIGVADTEDLLIWRMLVIQVADIEAC